jgi:hypothetical protein
MLSSRFPFRARAGLACLLALLLLAGRAGHAAAIALDAAGTELVTSGILLDLSPDLAGAGHYDGLQATPPASPALFRQLVFQLNRASVDGATRVDASRLRQIAREARPQALIPLALLDMDYQQLKAGAVEQGRARVDGSGLRILDADALQSGRLFVAAALVEHTGNGGAVTFQLPAGERWISNRTERPQRLEVDLADGAGFVSREPGEQVVVRYASTGDKTLRLRATWADGDTRETSMAFTVKRLITPEPGEVWNLTSAYPYQGAAASGTAYIHLAPGHTVLTRPVVLCEGFDMDNTMFWEELYELGNQQGLVDTLHQQGFDMVVLNFSESTDYIQRNGLLLATLLEQINSVLPAGERYPLIGASMGGLVSRYALAWLEQQGIDPRVRTLLSFDSPQTGANIPLSLQHWLAFFAQEAEEAAYFRSRLQTPAARQMLLVMAETPPDVNPEADPLRQVLLDELAALGGYPTGPRLVAVANGSGTGLNQGFAAGAQLIRYEYRSWLVDIDGNCWSLADQAPQLIFRGMVNQIWPFPDRNQTVNINGAPPWDNAPGGYRNTMVELDQSAVPYGDIVALHANHCFIPTTSALGLVTDAPFRPIHGAPDLLELTPFDALYYPLGGNEDHVSISPESLWWFLGEIVPELAAPELTIQLVEEGVQLGWNPVPLARSYRIQQTADPAHWPVEYVATAGLGWTAPLLDERMFYRVTASMEVAGP